MFKNPEGQPQGTSPPASSLPLSRIKEHCFFLSSFPVKAEKVGAEPHGARGRAVGSHSVAVLSVGLTATAGQLVVESV